MLTRPEVQLPQRQSLSAREPLRFDWERFPAIHHELPRLFKRHWREIALDQKQIPLDPDWDYYLEADNRGILFILTARAAETGILAGYIFNVVGPHAHYRSTRFANSEMFYLHDHFRNGWHPVRMFKENLKGLKTMGVQVSLINFKLHFQDGRVGKLLARLGYAPTDIVMRKRL